MSKVKLNDVLFEKLKQKTIDLHMTVDFERIHWLNESYREFDGEAPVILRAKFYDKLLTNKKIYIDENLFVGTLASAPGKYYLYPEFGVDWTDDPAENFTVPEEYRRDWEEASSYWKGRTLENRSYERFHKLFDSVGEEYGFAIEDPLKLGLSHDHNHTPAGGGNLNYGRVIREGLLSMIEEAKERQKALDTRLSDNGKYEFYEAVIIELSAIIKLARRYEELALKLADEESDPERKQELFNIADVIGHVPANPARDLRDAIQSQWFMHICAQLEQVGCAYSLGYLGQTLEPFYQREKAEGTINEEEAVYLLKHFYLKLNDIAYYYGRDYDELNSGDLAETISIGGFDEDGNDATAEFDYLVLEAQRQVKLPQPSIALFFHSKLKPDFVKKALDLVATGIGMPQFMNANVAVQRSLEAYSRYGATIKDARRTGVYGCVSTAICDKSVFLVGPQFNLAKAVELVLNDGLDPLTGKQLGPHTGKASDFKSFDEFLKAYEKQLEVGILLCRKLGQLGNIITEEILPLPLRSALVDGCLESGLDLYSGGTKFIDAQFTFVGGVDAANSLSAIRSLVYEDKKLTIEELNQALHADFEGFEDIRKLALDSPKHGNGDEGAKELTRYVYKTGYRIFEEIGENFLGLYARPDAYSKSVHNYFGLLTGALPSGRKAGIALTDGSVSATPGTDLDGPTALISDAASAIDTLAFDSSHLNVKLSPNQFKSTRGYQAVRSLVKGFMDLGGNHIQFNCIDSKILKDAKAHPEEHKDLVVRVAGFSAYFVKLHPGVQDEIIERTEHAVGE